MNGEHLQVVQVVMIECSQGVHQQQQPPIDVFADEQTAVSSTTANSDLLVVVRAIRCRLMHRKREKEREREREREKEKKKEHQCIK